MLQDNRSSLNGHRTALEQQLAQSISERDLLERERGAVEARKGK